jgi:hypothetical protein
LPKSDPPPTAKPINKARISEFAALLSTSVHLTVPSSSSCLKSIATSSSTPIVRSSPAHSDESSSSLNPSASTDRDDNHSRTTFEHEQTTKHIDARYNERIDDRGTIKVKTANIKAIFEQKISTSNRILSQSSDHLAHTTISARHVSIPHRKVPVSYGSLKHHSMQHSLTCQRVRSSQDAVNMVNYTSQLANTKHVVIEDKQVRTI